MIKKRVLLITPPYHAGVVEAAGRWPNLGFVYVAGHVRAAGFEVRIYDAMTKGHDLATIKQEIRAFKPDFVATTGYTSSVAAGIRVLETAKEINSDIITIMGGIDATFRYQELLRNSEALDFVVRGEGEETLPELLNALCSGKDLSSVAGIAFRNGQRVIALPKGQEVTVTAEREFCPNLDRLIPAWDLVDWEDYTFFVLPGSRLSVIQSSRGCVNSCSFCSQQKFWKKSYRARTAEAVVSELEFLSSNYGVNVVMLSDEYPTRDRARWEQILDLLCAKGLRVYLLLETCVEDILRDQDILPKYRQAGVVHIYLGVESTDPDRLDDFCKHIRVEQSRQALKLLNQAGIISECSFILGLPDETPASIARTLELAQSYRPDFAHFLHITPWPYSDIYPELESLIEVWDYEKYNFTEPIVKPLSMTREEVADSLIDCYKEYYMDSVPNYDEIKDPFKRTYMQRSLEVMMKNSFLKEKLGKDHESAMTGMDEKVSLNIDKELEKEEKLT